MTIRLACGDYAWPNLSHDFVLDLIVELGFEAVDIGLFSGYSLLTPEDVRGDVDGAAEQLAAKLADRRLAVSDVFAVPNMNLVGMSVSNPDADEQRAAAEFFRDLLRFTVRLGGGHMTLLPGTALPEQSLDDSLRLSSEQLAWRVEDAANHGVSLAVEPHTGSNLEAPDQVLRLLDQTPGLSLSLDYGHFVYAGVDQRSVDPLLAHASHVHCRGGRPGLVQTRLVDNEIDFRRIIAALQARGYDGYVAVEYVHDDRPGCSECDNLQEVLAFRRHLEELLAEQSAAGDAR